MSKVLVAVAALFVLSCGRNAEKAEGGAVPVTEAVAAAEKPTAPEEGGLSKGEARKLLDEYYRTHGEEKGDVTKRVIVEFPLSETSRDAMYIWNQYAEKKEETSAVTAGLLTADYVETSPSRPYDRVVDWVYGTSFTTKGKEFDRGGNDRYHSVKIGGYAVDEVTGVFAEGNKATVYYTITFQPTPFFGSARGAWGKDFAQRQAPMTAVVVSNGKDWSVEDVIEGTESAN